MLHTLHTLFTLLSNKCFDDFADQRKQLFDFDQVLNTQRENVYTTRRMALMAQDLTDKIVEFAEKTADDILEVGRSSNVLLIVEIFVFWQNHSVTNRIYTSLSLQTYILWDLSIQRISQLFELSFAVLPWILKHTFKTWCFSILLSLLISSLY